MRKASRIRIRECGLRTDWQIYIFCGSVYRIVFAIRIIHRNCRHGGLQRFAVDVNATFKLRRQDVMFIPLFYNSTSNFGYTYVRVRIPSFYKKDVNRLDFNKRDFNSTNAAIVFYCFRYNNIIVGVKSIKVYFCRIAFRLKRNRKSRKSYRRGKFNIKKRFRILTCRVRNTFRNISYFVIRKVIGQKAIFSIKECGTLFARSKGLLRTFSVKKLSHIAHHIRRYNGAYSGAVLRHCINRLKSHIAVHTPCGSVRVISLRYFFQLSITASPLQVKVIPYQYSTPSSLYLNVLKTGISTTNRSLCIPLMVGYVIVKNPAFVKIIFLSFKRSPLDKYPHGTLKTLR